jgi:hypothetical protein
VRFDDLAGNVQAQADTGDIFLFGGRGAPKTFEQVLMFLFWITPDLSVVNTA